MVCVLKPPSPGALRAKVAADRGDDKDANARGLRGLAVVIDVGRTFETRRGCWTDANASVLDDEGEVGVIDGVLGGWP